MVRPVPVAEDAARATYYARWLRRVAALAIDLVVVSVVPLSVAFVAFLVGGAETEGDLYDALDRFVWLLLIAFAAAVVVPTVYFTVLIARTGQTLGKRSVGIAVRDARDPSRPIGYGRALGRWLITALAWWLYLVPGLVDALWPLWDVRNQSLHDKAVRSVVVRL